MIDTDSMSDADLREMLLGEFSEDDAALDAKLAELGIDARAFSVWLAYDKFRMGKEFTGKSGIKPDLETSLSMFVLDADFASIYPRLMCNCNISRMTLSSAMFEIEGRPFSDIPHYFACLITPRINAESICSQFHGMPTFIEIASSLRTQLQADGLID